MSRKHFIDTSVYDFKRVHGDITVIGTWMGEAMEDSQAALVLMPTHRPCKLMGQLRAKPGVIPQSDAYLYREPDYLLSRSLAITEGMGFDISATRVLKVRDIIIDALVDLIKIPPRPVLERRVVADAVIVDSTGRSTHAEVHDDV